MKSWKVFLSIGIVIFLIGIAVFVSGFAAGGWKFGTDMDMQTFTSAEENTALDLSLAQGDMEIEFYDGENIEVDYPSSYPYTYKVYERGGKLSVKPARSSAFGIFYMFRVPTVTVKIPRGKIMDLSLSLSAGRIIVNGGEFRKFDFNVSAGTSSIHGIKCTSFDLNLSAGSASVWDLDCGNISIDLSAGSVNLTVNGKKSDYAIIVDKSAGSCNVSGQQSAVAGKVIDIDVSAGSVNVGFTN